MAGMIDKKALGKLGEKLAQALALQDGYTVITQNVRTPYGEIDLILEKEGVTVFAEVKTRSSYAFGFPEEAVSQRKLKHMIESAEFYLINEPGLHGWRLDVISLLVNPDDGKLVEVKWMENVSGY